MNKAIIIGTFGFLGFHLCKKVLDEGIEVIGYQIENNEKENEDKILEIGRNANFSIKSDEKWNFTCNENEEIIVFIDFYDFFIKKKEELFFTLDFLESEFKNLHFVFLLPSILLQDKFQQELQRVELLLDVMKDRDNTIQSFYIPTVYGPWQPEEFVFQQVLKEGKDSSINISERESTDDAIYVEDVVEAIFQEVKKKNERYLLQNKNSQTWEKCADLLGISVEQQERETRNFQGIVKVIENSTPVHIGIEKQRMATEIWRSFHK